MSLRVYYEVLNQKGSPALYTDTFANRPAFGFQGRLFISTDTGQIFEDTGSAWTLIADAGAGTTGTLQQVTTNGNTTTLGISVQGIDINDGAGTGANNMAIGSSALANNTTGITNTAIGFVALGNNTTGGGNVGVGFNALQFNTTGGGNTAIGTYALKANTTANNNTAIGFSSLQSNTTGQFNTAIGYEALPLNTTASSNTAIGNFSLNANTTGANNTAVGNLSLFANTTGTQNTALGSNSLVGNTTGGFNVGIGNNALQNNTTASYNTAIGTNTLTANTTGTQNIAIGYLSLYTNITGNQNVAIGNNALQYNTQNQNTAVGNASLGANTTGANGTAVGNQALQLNTTGQQNTAIGSGALANNTTANFNTAIGTSSLGSNTTGAQNTAIGTGSLIQNTTGVANTSVGYASLSVNTTGNYNIALGSGNGNALTTGQYNTLIGYNTGNGITTGSSNTIIGGNISGLSTTLSNNIILADGSGNIRYQFDGTNNVFGGNIITPQVRASTSAGLSINANSGTQIANYGAGGGANITFYGGLSFTSGTNINLGTTDNFALFLRANNTNIITLFPSGNAGINSTSDTGEKFQVTGTSRFNDAATFLSRINGVVGGTAFNTAGLWLQGSSATDGIAIGGTGSSNKIIETYGGNLSLNVGTQNNVVMGGIVAIDGNNSPSSLGIDKLSIGFQNGVDGWIQTWAGRPLSLNSQGNNVLIGTRTDAGQKLQVSGNALFTQSSGTIATFQSATQSQIGIIGTSSTSDVGVRIEANSQAWAVGINFFAGAGGKDFNIFDGTSARTPFKIYAATGGVNMRNLPTSAVGLASGDLWNNLGIVNIIP
jgi:hypothetical protein